MTAEAAGTPTAEGTATAEGTQPADWTPADTELFQRMDAYWRAANYLSVGQIYLCDNPLLREPLAPEHIKRMLLGHWGTTPGQNFIYTHLNRVINKYDLDMIYISGPGHGGPAVLSGTYLEGTYSEVYANVSEDEAGLKRLFTQFSFPGGVPSHASAECPGSIHEGGELGYSLSHAFGAVFDNPSLTVACVVGDGEAETGPLATAWHSNKFLNAATDGAVLPILHLNGYKIANPTLLARISRNELDQLLRGYGWTPYIVEGHEPMPMHRAMARPRTAPWSRSAPSSKPRDPAAHAACALADDRAHLAERVDGAQGGRRKAHRGVVQVPSGPDHRSGHQSRAPRAAGRLAQELSPAGAVRRAGPLKPELKALAPKGERRMGANPAANGGLKLRDLQAPGFRGIRGRRREARHRRHRGHPRARPVSARRGRRGTRRREISGFSVRTRPSRTVWRRSSRPRAGNGRRPRSPTTSSSRLTGG